MSKLWISEVVLYMSLNNIEAVHYKNITHMVSQRNNSGLNKRYNLKLLIGLTSLTFCCGDITLFRQLTLYFIGCVRILICKVPFVFILRLTKPICLLTVKPKHW